MIVVALAAIVASVVGGLTVLLGATLLLVRDLEKPFSGPTAIRPVAMLDTAQDDTEDYLATYPRVPLPCDTGGNAVRPTGP